MPKKKLSILLALPVLLIYGGPAGKCLADVASDLQQAETYVKRGEYAAAEQIYVQIASDHPGTEHAFAAQRKLAYVYIALDQPVEAQAAFAKMLTDFAGHERLPHAIHEIAENCNKLSKADEVRELCRNTLDSGLFAESAVWLQMGIAVSNAYRGNDAAADAAIEQLIRDFSADSRAAEGVGQTAWAYRKLQRHDRARVLYQYVLDNWPDNERAIFSQRGIVLTSIALDDEERATAATEELLAEFSRNPHIADVAYTIAEAYRDLQEYEKARELHRYVRDKFPGSERVIRAQRGIALCSIGLEDDPNTGAAIENLLTQFSWNENIPKVLYQIARKLNWRDDERAAELYEHIIAKYPDSDSAIRAKVNTGTIAIRRGDDETGRAIFDRILRDYKDHPLLPEAVGLMGQAYWDQAMSEERQGLQEQANMHFAKALAECQKVINDLPETAYVTPTAYCFAGDYYRHFGEYEKAIECYQAIVDHWPEYKHAVRMPSLIQLVRKRMNSTNPLGPKRPEDLTKRGGISQKGVRK